MAEEDVEDRPSKRPNKEKVDPIFRKFLANEENLIDLNTAWTALETGLSDMTLGVLHVDQENALDGVSFTSASIVTSAHNLNPDAMGEKPRGRVVGDIFINGLDVIRQFLDPKPRLPLEHLQETALLRLLNFLLSKDDHRVLVEEVDSGAAWSVKIAQHLLSKLAVNSTYTIAPYPTLKELKDEPKCLCKDREKLVGNIGDTSFGCRKGWHGSSDIIMQDVPVTVFQDTAGSDQIEDEFEELDNRSVSSIEVEVAEKFTKKDLSQIVAQTIVFAFLQQKLNEGNLKNCLIPGIGISKKKLIVCFYDCINDVLLQSLPINLFEEKTVCVKAVLFLWLTLNYRLFCSGITDDMKSYTADFVKKLGDCIQIYKDEVAMPMHVPHITDDDLFPWSTMPRRSSVRKNPDVKYKDLPEDI